MPDPLSFVRITGRRRALIHPDHQFQLKGCTADAYGMANFLLINLGFAPDDVRVITDENPWNLPTKENILEAMRALVYDAQPQDSFFFYFSGHGIQIKDIDADESDGLDECSLLCLSVGCLTHVISPGICAMNYVGDDPCPNPDTPGLIVDDIMHEIMVRSLPPQCRLTAIFDSCHSGTALDLPYIYDSKGAVKPFGYMDGPWVLQQKASSAYVVSLSGSKDNQEALETNHGGALKWAFIECMKNFDNTLTYKELIRGVREHMKRHGFPQRPQLSSSHEIDTNIRFIV
ncbi:peptidase C14, caspase domain-containing protein [Russula aff. rugulosa BPL654]|nr:peptidase C14, caspase domain-containing protein [Russula aff. rugulosa BPL654]